jgi:hypothetical protein
MSVTHSPDATDPTAVRTESRTEVQQLAAFVERVQYEDLSTEAAEQLKIRVLDTLGVAIGALDAGPMQAIRSLTEDLGGNPSSTLIGGGRTAPDRAAFMTSAQSRYLDFMDSYLAPGETCHPSDNFGAVLAASESVGGTGKELLTAFAVAYQVQSRLSDEAPVRARGFDHTVQGAYAAAASSAKALRLPAERDRHLRDREQRSARDPHREPLPLEGPGLPAGREGGNLRRPARARRDHRARAGLRGQQGIPRLDRG